MAHAPIIIDCSGAEVLDRIAKALEGMTPTLSSVIAQRDHLQRSLSAAHARENRLRRQIAGLRGYINSRRRFSAINNG